MKLEDGTHVSGSEVSLIVHALRSNAMDDERMARALAPKGEQDATAVKRLADTLMQQSEKQKKLADRIEDGEL